MERDRIAWVSSPVLPAGVIGLVLAVAVGLLHKPALPALEPLAWLLPLAAYDSQRREVPDISFVAVPTALAALAAIWRGDWTLGALAAVIVAASERHHLPKPLDSLAFVPALAGGGLLLWLTSFEKAPGAMALLGFWLAYEWGWWAGPDVLAAMTLAVLWPDIRLLVCLAAAHLAAALVLHRGRVMAFPRRLNPAELEVVGVAGLPAIALGAALFALWQWWAA